MPPTLGVFVGQPCKRVELREMAERVPDMKRRTKRPWSAADSEKLSSGVARLIRRVGKWSLILKHTQFEVCWLNVDLKDRGRIIAKTREPSHEVVQEAVPPADAVTTLSGLMQTTLPTE